MDGDGACARTTIGQRAVRFAERNDGVADARADSSPQCGIRLHARIRHFPSGSMLRMLRT
jgi:hypothetical protein